MRNLKLYIAVLAFYIVNTAHGQFGIFNPSVDCYNYFNEQQDWRFGDRCKENEHCCGTCTYRFCCAKGSEEANLDQDRCLNNDYETTFATERPPILNYPGIIAACVVIVPLIFTIVLIIVCWRNESLCFRKKYPPPGPGISAGSAHHPESYDDRYDHDDSMEGAP